jgi:hypothetical protein
LLVHTAGGLLADSGVALAAMGDKNSDMIIAVACVSVGFSDDEGGEPTARSDEATKWPAGGEFESYEAVLNELEVWG